MYNKMSSSDYVALFADDDPANLEERDKFPHICCIPVSDTPIVIDYDSGMYIRSKANTNRMQQEIDERFTEDFGDERLYHARSGLNIRQIDGIYDHAMMHPNIRHVFFDHDLTLTCHQGLISIDQMNKVCATFPLTVSKHFDQWVSYFFGSTRRYQALHQLLDNLNAKGIKTYIITKQPDTLTIEHFMRLCKLHTFFPHSRCISSTLVGKEKLAIINEVTGSSSHVSRSPRHQSKGTTASDASVGDAPRKKSGKRPDAGSTNASPPQPSPPPTLSSGRSQASRNVASPSKQPPASPSSIARLQSPASAIATFPPPTTTGGVTKTATSRKGDGQNRNSPSRRKK
jgi:hypothetical protein